MIDTTVIAQPLSLVTNIEDLNLLHIQPTRIEQPSIMHLDPYHTPPIPHYLST